LHNQNAQFTGQVEQLGGLLQTGQSAQQLQQLAIQAGLQAVVTAIITAWYTGTVGHGQTAELIAYKDALMYRPAGDALIVPTYCGNGPLWWTAPPPAVNVSL
ncbi:MAG: dehydrogenase, partial [Serratia liquefaciens]|nr:dehydrogenase [Serratia liquefaciens]